MSNQIAVREQRVMNAFELDGIKNQLANLLENNPKKMEAFKTRILNMSLSYGLKDCTPESIISCGLQALTVNLPLQSGQGYIVNYGGQAQFDCGYKGWQVLAKRAGYSVTADVVYSCDIYRQEGFGFGVKTIFEPNFSERKGHDDAWAKQNLAGVIVSIRQDETGETLSKFIEAGLIFKITAMSPSQKSEKGKKFSPHENWAEQMFCAKAIKHVLSKFAIDLSETSSDLHTAIEYANQTESVAQQQAMQKEAYSQESFDKNFPEWLDRVKSGRNKAMAIITQLSNGYSISEEQMTKVMTLIDYEPIEAEAEEEVTNAE